MTRGTRIGLGTLRRRIRGVAVALLPVLALTAASAPACVAMETARASVAHDSQSHPPHHGGAHAAHDSGAHAAHDAHAHGSPAPAPSDPCPHCPLESGAAIASHAVCVVAEGQASGGIAHASFAFELPAALFSTHVVPAASAVPPLIAPRAGPAAPSPAAPPLNVRYCVYLI